MVHAPREKKIIKECQLRGTPLPKSIQSAPTLFMGLQLYLYAFYDLDNSRSIGMSEGYIPWQAIQTYAELNGFSEQQTEDLHHYIPAMDGAFLEQREKTRKNK